MPSNREEIAEFKKAIEEFFKTTHPWLHSLEKRCTACKSCCEKVLEKVNDLDTRVIAMEERLERQELILSDHLIQQEMMRCKLEELASQFETANIALGYHTHEISYLLEESDAARGARNPR